MFLAIMAALLPQFLALCWIGWQAKRIADAAEDYIRRVERHEESYSPESCLPYFWTDPEAYDDQQ